MMRSLPLIGEVDAIGGAVATATWLIGVALERIVGDSIAAWADRHGLSDDVGRLQAELRRANLVLGAAASGGGKKIGNKQLAEPLAAVRRLAYDARNILDELDYFGIQEKIKDNNKSCNNLIASTAQSFVQFACGFANQTSNYISSAVKISTKNSAMHQQGDSLATKRKIERCDVMTGIKRMKLVDSDDKMAPERKLESGKTSVGIGEVKLNKADISRRITNIVEQLHDIYNDVRRALKQEKLDEMARATQSTTTNPRVTASNTTEHKVFSREQETNRIIELMTNAASSNQELSILPIIGIGGVGKTTLARLVYNDPRVETEFAIKIWIYVSANFDEVKLTQEIWECLSADGRHEKTTNFNMLQEGVKKSLSKRFLLVLDDMWEDKETSRWDKLLAPLRCAQVTGNVILVTTRNLSVAKITSTMEHFNLDGLKGDVFWHFFKRCIFGDENYQGHKRLQKIGLQIAKKLKGNPLAAKSVGTLLKRKLDEGYWRRILDSDEWKLQEGMDNILPALMLSYNHLPSHLQRCFSYCALFPKGSKFDKEQLVRIWIAQGFAEDKRKRMEDTVNGYFDDLVDRSFFQKFEETRGDAYYLMHDLIHDLAQNVSSEECLTVDGSEFGTILLSIQHVTIVSESAYSDQGNGNIERNESFENKLANIQNTEVLRSLGTLMLVGAYDQNFAAKFVKILEQLQYVRVLRLHAMPFDVDVLLSNISKFIHLRYLELRSTDKGGPLPDALCRLYHLQVLDIRFWRDLVDLPRGMSNLVNLHHLLVPGSGMLHSRIARVGELKFLQELKEFRVRKESGFEIGQLKNLNDLRGSLSIYNLENVTKTEEATCARIRDKKHLRTLSLSWGRASSSPAVQNEVLEGLEPNDCLEHLQISKYVGATPSWLRANFSLSNLESLHLEDCTAMEILPPFEQLPFLEKLSLIRMSALKEVKFDFNCSSVDAGSRSSEEDLLGPDEISLTELKISDCSGLTSVRLHSCVKLQKLSIEECVVLASLDGLQSLDQLTHLEVWQCPRLAAAPDFATQCQNVGTSDIST